MLVHRYLRPLIVLITVLVIIMTFVPSCKKPQITEPTDSGYKTNLEEKTPVDQPDQLAATPGYKLHEGRLRDMLISFEYPDTWSRHSIGDIAIYLRPSPGEDLFEVEILSWDVALKGVTSDEKAPAVLQYYLDTESTTPEFQIISRGKIILSNVEGEEVCYSLHIMGRITTEPISVIRDRVQIRRRLSVDYKGLNYLLSFFVDADKYEEIKPGFEHVIATFRFLE